MKTQLVQKRSAYPEYKGINVGVELRDNKMETVLYSRKIKTLGEMMEVKCE